MFTIYAFSVVLSVFYAILESHSALWWINSISWYSNNKLQQDTPGRYALNIPTDQTFKKVVNDSISKNSNSLILNYTTCPLRMLSKISLSFAGQNYGDIIS